MVQSAPNPRPEAAGGPAAEARRREILGAASRLFRARGLHATGMREIAAELGMTAGNLYYYFPSKQELLAYCQEETLGQLLALERRVRRSGGSAAEKLGRWIAGHVTVLNQATPGSLAHLEIDEVPAVRHAPLLARRRRYEAALRRLLEQGIASGELRAVDSRLATLALLGALNWTVKWFQPDGRKSAEEVGREFAELLLGGLLRPVGGSPTCAAPSSDRDFSVRGKALSATAPPNAGRPRHGRRRGEPLPGAGQTEASVARAGGARSSAPFVASSSSADSATERAAKRQGRRRSPPFNGSLSVLNRKRTRRGS